MRVVQNPQKQVGEVDISAITFDRRSRDDISKILRGLQHIYTDLPMREVLFQLLEAKIALAVDKSNGRPGMTLWSIFVCGIMRLDLNIDDRLHDLVNHHNTLREMLGQGAFDNEAFHYQTLKDNVKLFTPELLDEINQLVVASGHLVAINSSAKPCMGVATPSWLKPKCITPSTSTCCTTRCAQSSP